MQRPGAEFCMSVWGEGAQEPWASAPCVPHTGIPAKHMVKQSARTLTSTRQTGLSLFRLVAAEGRTQGMLLALGSLGGVGMQSRVPPSPWRTARRPQPLLPRPPYLPPQSRQSHGCCWAVIPHFLRHGPWVWGIPPGAVVRLPWRCWAWAAWGSSGGSSRTTWPPSLPQTPS